MLQWGVIQAWKGSRLNPNGKCRTIAPIQSPVAVQAEAQWEMSACTEGGPQKVMKLFIGLSAVMLIVLPLTAQEKADIPQPGARNTVIPLFQAPFSGEFTLTNYFDHSLPKQFKDNNGYQLNFKGLQVRGGIDGHSGYDWVMPTGTPLLAVANGVVDFARSHPPFFCPPLKRTVRNQRYVQLRHRAPNGEVFASVYVHLSRTDVSEGQRVRAGQVIGLSGNTGCSTEPHLHFHVRRYTNTNNGNSTRIDPYGWQGKTFDPWQRHPDGAKSVWLWKANKAPKLIKASHLK